MTAIRAALILILVSLPALASAETVLVEPGDNLAAAFRGLLPGDELVFASGTFELTGGLDVSVDGNGEAPIVIRGAGESVLTAPGADFTLRVEGAYFDLRDLRIEGPGVALILSGERIRVRNVSFSGASSGIVCEDCDQTTIRDSEFRAITAGDGAAIRSEAFVNSDVTGNWIHNVMGDGVRLVGRTVNASVVDNIVRAVAGDGIHVAFPTTLAAGRPNQVIGNFVGQAAGSGIVSTGGAFISTNIVTDFAEDGVRSTLGAAMSELDAILTHNTVVGTTTCFRAVEWSLSAATNIVANNAFFCGEGTAFIFDDGVGMSTIVQANVYDGNSDFPGDSIVGNGLSDFVDAEAGNFYPSSESALVNAGLPRYQLNLDFNGTRRDALPDAGAYERVSASNPGPIPGNGFKGTSSDDPDDPDNAAPGPTGPSGGASGGGTTGFPERDGCGCASTSGSDAVAPLLVLAFLLGRRRRRR